MFSQGFNSVLDVTSYLKCSVKVSISTNKKLYQQQKTVPTIKNCTNNLLWDSSDSTFFYEYIKRVCVNLQILIYTKL